MEFCLCRSTYILGSGALLVLIHTCLCMKLLLQKMNWHRLRKECFAIGKALLFRIARYMSKAKESKELTPYDELVMRKFAQRRLEIAGIAIFAIANVNAGAIVFSLSMMATGNPAAFSDWQIICLLCSMALSICAYSVPPSTPKLSEVYYGGMMIICTTFVLSSPPNLFVFSLRASYVIRFVLSVSSLNIKHMVFWNVAVLIASFIYTTSIPLDHTFGDLFLSFDIMFTVACIVVSIAFERWLTSTVERETEIVKLKLDKSSSMSLLDVMCDVVLELSDKFKIVCESRNFGALMSNTGSSLQGQSFSSFIEDDLGRETFEYQLIAGTRQESKVGVCHTTLMDCLRNRIKVDIFFVKVEMDVDIHHYMCGIRESSQENIGVDPSFSPRDVRARRPSKRKGTPPASERSDLSQIHASSGELRHPWLKLTEDFGRCLSLETCLSSWNISTTHSACCFFHAYISAGKRSLSEIAQSPCREHFPTFPTEGLQCQTCGMIIGDAEENDHDTCPTCDSLELGAFRLNEADGAGEAGVRVENRRDESSQFRLSM
eukprot:TRINITY_DN14034_c0_g1_i4.p1 TRINITY_DN14034_c0_g1~~TRINITY_DN14034_c0_g1_i4.p1  ORF type:complete len:546 (+),score=83.12 TRINITY_DN14034_c0_g1_i4:83-1720(+)